MIMYLCDKCGTQAESGPRNQRPEEWASLQQLNEPRHVWQLCPDCIKQFYDLLGEQHA